MLTVITPMVGKETYTTSEQCIFPKILSDINGKTLFEYSQSYLKSIDDDILKIFLRPQSINYEFKIDSIIQQMIVSDVKIIDVNDHTAGALCTCLLAADCLNDEDELIIVSADQFIDINTQDVINYFRSQESDVGLVTFPSMHPRWSYLSRNDSGDIIEVFDKRIVSNEALTSFFYFKKSHDFLKAAKTSILKCSDSNYHLSSCINEMILVGKKVSSKMIDNGSYFNFYDFNAISRFSSEWKC